jgi:hypothetical protein
LCLGELTVLSKQRKSIQSRNTKKQVFDALIARRWGTSINPPTTDTEDSDNSDNEFEEYEDDDESARVIPEIEDSVDANGCLRSHLKF